MANLASIVPDAPQLKYVQLDDGYQPAMGDWLETGKAFGGNVQGVLEAIRGRRFEPAILGAPFVAEPGSNRFQAHPDWFVQDAAGAGPRSPPETAAAGPRRPPG